MSQDIVADLLCMCLQPPSENVNSTSAMHYQPPYHRGEGGQGRGRARGGRQAGQSPRWSNGGRDNGGLNGGAGGVGSLPADQPARWQRPGAGYGQYRGDSNVSRDVQHASEDQDTLPKNNKEFNQEPRGMVEDVRGMNGSESRHKPENQRNGAVGEGSRSAASREHNSEMRERHQRGRKGADWNLRQIHPQLKHVETKPCQGPIESAKTSPEEQRDSDRGAGGKERVQERRASLQNRERLRTCHRPAQKNNETQTACLIEQLSEEKYECMVCCDVIGHTAPVWSCHICYHVFHLRCIKKWARASASQAEDATEGWRCPACQNVAQKQPTSYICFCGKVTNPQWQRTEIPHSCGDMCGKKRRVDCDHRCNILCHPGPCPQCPAFVTKSCVCGRTTQPMRCGQAAVVQCDRVCGEVLNCAEHTCVQVCHGGTCRPCQLLVQQVCYCGITSREALCGADNDEFDGSGHFSCQKPCGKILDCDAHRCEQVCHPGPCQPCPLSPRMVKTCPCGQTPLAKLLELGHPERQTCSDPIPSCGKACSKLLACGSNDTVHICEMLCHAGSCGSCSLTSTITCRCGSKTKEVPCETINNEDQLVFTCGRRCNKKRTCGRHKCAELCCANVEHKCTQVCGYKLNCGIHHCLEPCHRGLCQRCLQSSFDELTCHCGQTVMYPPIACGTKPPECTNPCTRRHECDHPVLHSCHSEEKCPPCTHLTRKWCMGKHEQRSNIACHLQDISCGLPCDKVLPCEMHRCKHLCHRGQCLVPCHQPCLLPRPECGHPCSAPCHKGSSCPRRACTAAVALQCHCGRRKESVACTEAIRSYQKYAAIAMASKLSDMSQSDSVDIGQLITKRDVTQLRLECDQECATLERNRRLAEALQIDTSVHPFHSTPIYSDSLKEDARKDLRFVRHVEEKIRNVVELASEGQWQKRSHCFPPMNQEHRRIVHELAKAYGVESMSYDSAPKRNVVITAHRGRSVCPHSTLTSLIEREVSRGSRAPPPIAHIKQHSGNADLGSCWSKAVKEPVIDYFDFQD